MNYMISEMTFSNINLISECAIIIKDSITLNSYNRSNKDFFGCVTSLSNTKDEKIDIIQNKKKLKDISKLENDWNSNGAKSISRELIKVVERYLDKLYIQPEIFPMAGGSIQLEYDFKSGDHIEFEVSLGGEIEVYVEYADRIEKEFKIPANVKSINEVLKQFYE